MQDHLFELKTLHAGTSTYSGGDAQRCAAVARRARAVATEYLAKARRLDQQFCHTASGLVGPVERRLLGFGPVRGLVFGHWGEASADVEQLLAAIAFAGAQRHWRSMRTAAAEDAVGAVAWLLRRRWALTAVRENARLLLERLELVGCGAAVAARRRQRASADVCARVRRTALSLRGRRRAGRWE